MEDEFLPPGLRIPGLLQAGGEGAAVREGAGRRLQPEEGSQGCGQILEADEGGTDRSGRSAAGPAQDQGHPVPALVDVGLHAPPGTVGAMPEGLDVGGGPVRTVVGSEDHQGVLRQTFAVQGRQQRAHDGVHLDHEVAVDAGFAASSVFGEGEPGSVRGGEGELQEEGLAGAARAEIRTPSPALRLQEGHGPGLQGGQTGLVGEARRPRPGPPEAGASLTDGAAGSHLLRRQRPGAQAVRAGGDEGVGREVQGGRQEEGAGEAQGVGAGVEGRPEVGVRFGALGVEAAEPEVPLAEEGSGVAGFLEQGGQGRPSLFDQGAPVAVQDPGLQARAPGVAAGEDAVAGRRADRRRRVGVGEAQSLGCQAVEGRGRNPGVRVVAAGVALPQVVGQDQEDVRVLGRGRPFLGGGGQEDQDGGEQAQGRLRAERRSSRPFEAA